MDAPGPSAPGVDLGLLPYQLTWPRFVLSQVLVGGMVAMMIVPAIGGHLALASWLPVILFAAWPLAYGVLMVFGARLFLDDRLRPVQYAFCAYAVAAVSSIAACSSLTVSPAYVALLWIPPCWGHLFPGNRAIAWSLVASPVVIRAATVPGASPASLAIALVIGAAVCAAYLVFSWRRFLVRARRRRELAAEALGAASVAGAGDRWTALRLHDSLSGVVMLARARGGDPALASLVVERARQTLADTPRGAPMRPAEVADGLRALGAALSLEVGVVVRSPDRASAAWRELHDLLVELVSNHARHGRGALSIRLAMTAGIARVRVGAASTSPLAAPEGRGRRGLALRVDALGGVIRWRTTDEGWSVTIAVPALDAPPGLRATMRAIEVVAHGVALGLAATTSLAVVAVLGSVTAVLGAIQAIDLRRDRADHAARRAAVRAAIDDAATAAIERSRATLAPLIDALERADGAERRDAIARLATTIHELMANLEAVSGEDRAARA